MEVKGSHRIKGYVCFFEAVGSAWIMFTINWGASIPGFEHGPISVGIILFSAILCFGPVCGGHFNPAVTLGVLVREGTLNLKPNVIYCAQIILA